MIIKKFQASTEKEAILMAKDELGADAIVMNVKTIKPTGVFRLFRKTKVELTAAIDDNVSQKTKENKKSVPESPKEEAYRFGTVFEKNNHEEYSEETQSAIEEKINSIARLLEQQVSATKESTSSKEEKETGIQEEGSQEAEKKEKPQNKVLELITQQLIENEVKPQYADAIIEELDCGSDAQSLDNVLANTYQKIVLKLGQVEPISGGEKKPKIVFFVGNTGVGKTTTMAKLASKFKLEEKSNIAMFSVDTYRIAAIEQIKTYANILNTPMEVVYTPEEMKNLVDKYQECDLIFVDTAGRSHKDEEQKNDLQAIIDSVSEYEKEVFLVVSATTKYGDLKSIAQTYEGLFDYKLIFTKLDETRGLGNILNLKMDTGKSLAYVTWGQNVPDDIGMLNPQVIAKKLLGGTE